MRPEGRDVFLDMVAAGYPDFKTEPLPDKEGKPAFQMLLNPKAKTRLMKMAVDQALETIRNRIDQFGVSEPDIRPQEENRLLI